MNLFAKIKPYLKIQLLIGTILGGLAGYLYYYFVGCNSNSCAITSDPVKSVLFGMLFGFVLFFPENKKNKNNKSE